MDLTRLARDLSFVRATISRSARFEALSRPAVAATGYLALLTSVASAYWLQGSGVPARLPAGTVALLGSLWGGLFVVCASINCLAMERRLRRFPEEERFAVWTSLLSALVPGLAAGGVLTVGLVLRGELALLPVCWLACYGASQMAVSSRCAPELFRVGMATLCASVGCMLVPGFEVLWLAGGLGLGHLVLSAQLGRRREEWR
jgi:hypothetical protein